MSVLVEAVTLVVERRLLDARYPGGTAAFLHALLDLENAPRFVCNGDEHLINASFYDAPHFEPASELLVSHGLIDVENDEFRDFAFVDQKAGPLMPCAWLEWKIHSEGFTYAWLAGTPVGDMAAPDDWTAERSRQISCYDIRDEPGRCLMLATENGVETWLDFETGALMRGVARANPPRREPSLWDLDEEGTAMGEREPGELMGVIQDTLRTRGWQWIMLEPTIATLSVRAEHAVYDVLLVVYEDIEIVACYCSFSPRVAEHNRSAMTELLNRINWQIVVGAFEMDRTDGEVRVRNSVDVEGGELTTKMVENLVDAAVTTGERWHDHIMQVAFEAKTIDLEQILKELDERD